MIPIRDHNPTSRTAYVTLSIIALNAVVFLFVQPTLRGGSEQGRQLEQERFFACNASISYEVTHGKLVSEDFPARPPTIDSERELISALQEGVVPGQEGCPRKNIWLSIVKSMFLHGGWFHIIGNMLFLWVFGNNVEDRLGVFRFVLFYVLAGSAAAFAQSYVTPNSTVPMIGASGAVAGILGAYLIMFPRARVTTLVFFFFVTAVDLPAVVVLGIWFVMQSFQSLGSVTGDVGGVAYMAHVGGFVAGMLLLLIFRPRRERPAFYA